MDKQTTKRTGRGRRPETAEQKAMKKRLGFYFKSKRLSDREKQLKVAIDKYQNYLDNCKQELDRLPLQIINEQINELNEEQKKELKNSL